MIKRMFGGFIFELMNSQYWVFLRLVRCSTSNDKPYPKRRSSVSDLLQTYSTIYPSTSYQKRRRKGHRLTPCAYNDAEE
jgi:hypothetical protein